MKNKSWFILTIIFMIVINIYLFYIFNKNNNKIAEIDEITIPITTYHDEYETSYLHFSNITHISTYCADTLIEYVIITPTELTLLRNDTVYVKPINQEVNIFNKYNYDDCKTIVSEQTYDIINSIYGE